MVQHIQRKINVNKEMFNKLLTFKNKNMTDEVRFMLIKEIEFVICQRIFLEKYLKQKNNKKFLEKMVHINYEMIEYSKKKCAEGFYLDATEICKDLHEIIESDKNYIIERV